MSHHFSRWTQINTYWTCSTYGFGRNSTTNQGRTFVLCRESQPSLATSFHFHHIAQSFPPFRSRSISEKLSVFPSKTYKTHIVFIYVNHKDRLVIVTHHLPKTVCNIPHKMWILRFINRFLKSFVFLILRNTSHLTRIYITTPNNI